MTMGETRNGAVDFIDTNGHNNVDDDERHDDIPDEELDFSDPPGFVDDIEDEDLLPDILEQEPRAEDGLENCIVIDNLPVVGADRIEKLKSITKKVFQRFGEIVTESMPVDETGTTLGYMFIEYSDRESSEKAVKSGDGFSLDKTHVLAVNHFSDIDRYLAIPDEMPEPAPAPYKDRGNLWSWLQEPDSYDQFSLLYEEAGVTGSVYVNSQPEPVEVMKRPRWTESVLTWSPLGTYLASHHPKGIAIWAGPQFEQFQRYPHDDVSMIDFSPSEKYLVTFSPRLASAGSPHAIIVWDLKSGIKKRTFHADQSDVSWPVLKWSHDDRFFARLTRKDNESLLSIFETPTCGMLDKKSLKIPGLRSFAWSPTQNILSYWVAEDKDVPARVTLIEIPSRREVRSKNLFSVASCRLHWQKSGNYLCVKVDRYSKLKKEASGEVKYAGMYYNFDVFHMREKEIPVDSVEVRDTIVAFSWEPVGNKFAIIHGDGPTFSVSFYGLKTSTHGISSMCLLKKLENRQCNHLFWSPTGQFIVLAGLKNMNDVLEWIDTSDFTTTNMDEHFMATDIEWDPTGRYVVTAVSWWVHRSDNSYWVWTFNGRLIRKQRMEHFYQLLWRPRPPSLLSEEKVKELRKNLKSYSTQFETKDRLAQSRVSKEILEKRQKLVTDFSNYRKRKTAQYLSLHERRLELRGDEETDPKLAARFVETADELVQLLVSEETVVISEANDE